ncbi:MAG: MraY family glycosyltransferase [Alistipes sp.]|nr:MraY family glycosyltransferase [Alistipes sp.]
MVLNLFVFITLLVSAALGLIMIPRIILISQKKRLFDELTDRKVHHGNIPRLGGVSFFPSFLFSVTFMMGLRYYYGFNIASTPLEYNAFREMMLLFTGATLVFLTGLADDLTGLSYKNKFVVQIFVAVLLVFCGLRIENLGGLFGLHHIPTWTGSLLTVLIVVLLMNAYNLIDGIDGLCSGLALLALGTLGVWFLWNNLYVYAIMAMGIIGVVAVFFFFNISKRQRMKIFMGDTGSLTLGFLIAFLGLKFYNININTDMFRVQAVPAVLMGIVFIPVFDTIRVFCSRISEGLSPFHPDKRHIHHKLLRTGLNHFHSTIIILLLQAGFIIINILLSALNINVVFLINFLLGFVMTWIINGLAKKHTDQLMDQATHESSH